jgi:replicative DNA helicase
MSEHLGLRPFGNRLSERRLERESNKENKIKFGIPYLDDALSGIIPTDSVLFTAPSGTGKTEMVTQIAINAALQKKKVYLMALESYEGEVDERILYKKAAQRYYADNDRVPGALDYLYWAHGEQEHLLEKYYKDLEVEIEAIGKYIQVMDRGDAFSVDDLKKIFIQASKHDRVNLIILDHLHFMEIDDDNENRGWKNILKEMNLLIKKYKIPVLCVAHIRKRDRKQKVVAPGMDDVHGSSDIFKQVTKMISIAKAPNDGASKTLWPTYVRTAKVRHGGARDQFIGLINFDISKNEYSEVYAVGKLSYDETQVELLEQKDLPFWAKTKYKAMRG